MSVVQMNNSSNVP